MLVHERDDYCVVWVGGFTSAALALVKVRGGRLIQADIYCICDVKEMKLVKNFLGRVHEINQVDCFLV